VNVNRRDMWIVRQPHEGRSRIFALRAVCTHLGCIAVWQESRQRFRCPCHGSNDRQLRAASSSRIDQGAALRPSFTWCMGGVTFFLFLVEPMTGVLLMFYHRPTIEWAYHDMLDLRDVVSFGVVRGIHRWGGHAMVIAVMLLWLLAVGAADSRRGVSSRAELGIPRAVRARARGRRLLTVA
jgi:hypothetical protein